MGAGFSVGELLQYLIPVAMIFIIRRYYRGYLKFFPSWPRTLAMVMTPTWIILIYNFGHFIFSFNVLPIIVLIIACLLGIQLYDYVRQIEVFYFQAYYLRASKLIFVFLTIFLLGLIILRWWTLFH